jgi:starch-binding outer membrane protein, SusD/RagB family
MVSCSKTGFLDKIPSTLMHVPTTLGDMRRLLDDEIVLSQTQGFALLSAEPYYCTDQFWQKMSLVDRKVYTWEQNVYEGDGPVDDWDWLYKHVAYSNVVLAGLGGIKKDLGNKSEHEMVEGSALFIRAYAFYNLAQVFAAPYDHTNAFVGWGIPLRQNADISEKSVRASVAETYNKIIGDLKKASQFLPQEIDPRHPNHPSKPAVFAQLARVFLSMRKYDEAGEYADSCLRLYNKLIDFNSLDPANDFPFAANNAEVLYQSRLFNSCSLYPGLITGGCLIDSVLYSSFGNDDLRKSIYFKLTPSGKPTLKGTYRGDRLPFTGLAIDEVYLVRAECFARKGKLQLAIDDINTLLRYRWRTGHFVPFNTTSQVKALQLILEERNKELVLRGQRWTDIRRLNLEGAGITLIRLLNGKTYRLPPNDKRYVFLIPEKVIKLTGMPQNPR